LYNSTCTWKERFCWDIWNFVRYRFENNFIGPSR